MQDPTDSPAQLHHSMVHLHTIYVYQTDLLHPVLEYLQIRSMAENRHYRRRNGGGRRLLDLHIRQSHCIDSPTWNHMGGVSG